MTQPTSLPFGLRQVRITPYTDVSATVLAAASVALPNSQVFSFTENEEFEDLRGDDRLQTSHGKGPEIDWELTAGGLSIPAYYVLAGGQAPITTGVTPNRITTYRKLVTDQRVPFLARGRAISDAGGDMHCVVYRCKTTGELEGSFEDGKFFLTKAKGKGYASLISPIDTVYDFVQNETATVIA